LQQVGLLFTSVTNSGFITGLYVIIVPLLGLLLGHRTGSWRLAKNPTSSTCTPQTTAPASCSQSPRATWKLS
ncbi:hypothetical protein R0G64_31905, partial [Pseudomonas otitidis]|nr:hypothetical protein [Pseudomonas otitidis]